MNYIDTLYRALVDYRKNTQGNNECKSHRTAIIAANPAQDVIEVTRKNCTIEEDWIEAIERGLEFIEKAIKEERQFIRSNGEVIPIEKVKRVSKDSVEHLARHSNFFTRAPKEGEDLIPEHLYTVERLSDYAVYENRFLYMLLCYLRDFIGMRYEKIVELTNTYNGKMSMNKQFSESSRRVKYEVRLEEEKKNDEYLREHNKAQREIDRILTIYKAVVVYLNTPLMIEVAKSPMVKPPIMRTNVLKMNRNFREALTLYEYITAYDKDGYVITTETRTVSPFNGVVGEEMAEIVDLAFFLTYEHGLGIKDYLKENYDAEEQRRREAERKKLAEQITTITRNLKSSGLTPEEYIRMLQKRIHDMEQEEEELLSAHKKIEELQSDIHALKGELDDAHDSMRSLGKEITRLGEKYAADMAGLERERNERIREIQETYEAQMQALQTEMSAFEENKRQTEETLRAEIMQARNEYAEKSLALGAEYDEKSAVLEEKMRQNTALMQETQRRYESLLEYKAFNDARLTALRVENGMIGDVEDFSTKEQIDELERQYQTLGKFFKKEWGKTKRKLIKDMLAEFFAKKPKEEPVSLFETPETAAQAPAAEMPIANENATNETVETPQGQSQEEDRE